MKRALILIAITAFNLIPACREQFRSDFILIEGNQNYPMTMIDCYYLDNFKMMSEPGRNVMVPWEGKVLLINQNASDSKGGRLTVGIMTVPREINYRLAAALPSEIKPDSFVIAERSICRVVGRYDLPDSVNSYYCRDGYIRIDSVKSSKFMGYLWGKYFNPRKDSLIIDGHFRAVRKKQ